MRGTLETDVLVIGAGIAGCVAALEAADHGCAVTVVTLGRIHEGTSTARAQGGVVYRGRRDSIKALTKDILAAGDGLCDPDAVTFLAREGPNLVKSLLVERLQIPFDRTARGGLDLTREGGHAISRIVHCADRTGEAIAHALWRAVCAHKHISVRERATALDLLTTSHHSRLATDTYRPTECIGAYIFQQRPHRIRAIVAKETVLATGGLGKVYLHTTNGRYARGDGYAMALRAGARLANMEYVQFHPTTLYRPRAERFLITEAMRGEGAELRDARGRAFAKRYHPQGSLAPRDVVARAIHAETLRQGEQCMFLDITHKPADWIKSRFPTIYERCLEHDVDITREPIPVVPAAHYECGGVVADYEGRTSLKRLRAVGEVSCTGVHGANRLASTSLLEALVWGAFAGRAAAREIQSKRAYHIPPIWAWREQQEHVDPALLEQDWMIIRHTMWNYVGLVRGDRRLRRAQRLLRELQTEIETFYRRAAISDHIVGLRNGLQAARSILYAALRNPHSRGCHYRQEYDT